VLHACVELRLFELLAGGPRTSPDLAPILGLTLERAERLLDAAVSLKLLARRGGGYGLGPLGAAMVDNPAVTEMVRHHAMLYADLADPVALLRAPPGGTRLAAYWPYAGTDRPDTLSPAQIDAYTELMAASQPLVSAEILDAYDLRPHRCLLDVGGGDGRFLVAAAARHPGLRLVLFDLPAVADRAVRRFAAAGLSGRARAVGGDMHAGGLPRGADVVSLVRVIHDHDDAAALALLRAVREALPPDGTLLLAEPMDGTRGAEPIGAAYFAFYLMALGSGRARSPQTLSAMLRQAGFSRIETRKTATPLLTGLIVASP
jgi:demethylspheroidene O-methyltransferase